MMLAKKVNTKGILGIDRLKFDHKYNGTKIWLTLSKTDSLLLEAVIKSI